MAAVRKQFHIFKQFADYTFQKNEKSEVLSEDLASTEKRVELLRHCCAQTCKTLASCLQGVGSSDNNGSDKRMRRLPEVLLTQTMLDSAIALGEDSLLGSVLKTCSVVQGLLAREQLAYETDTERMVLAPLTALLEGDCPSILKLRKQLNKLVNEMGQAKAKYEQAAQHLYQDSRIPDVATMGKIDSLRAAHEDCKLKVEQCRDSLAAEMFGLLSKEPEVCSLFVSWYKLQSLYHRTVAEILDENLPSLTDLIDDSSHKAMFGVSLQDHLSVTNRQIAFVIEICVSYLLELGLEEEGLFRIAGSPSKLKKLKGALDAGLFHMVEDIRDPHTVSNLLKTYLRMLPEPLMTFELYEDFLTAIQISDHDEKLRSLWEAINSLPPPNLTNLRYLIKFLVKLTSNSAVNKMTPLNMAIVMAPNLLWPSSETQASEHFGVNMALASLHTTIVETLILYADYFFPEDMEFISNPLLLPKTNSSPSPPSCKRSISAESVEPSEPPPLSRIENGKVRIRKKVKKPAPPIPTQKPIPENGQENSESTISRRHSSVGSDIIPPKKPPRRQSVDSSFSDSSLSRKPDSSSASSPCYSPDFNDMKTTSSAESLTDAQSAENFLSKQPRTPDPLSDSTLGPKVIGDHTPMTYCEDSCSSPADTPCDDVNSSPNGQEIIFGSHTENYREGKPKIDDDFSSPKSDSFESTEIKEISDASNNCPQVPEDVKCLQPEDQLSSLTEARLCLQISDKPQSSDANPAIKEISDASINCSQVPEDVKCLQPEGQLLSFTEARSCQQISIKPQSSAAKPAIPAKPEFHSAQNGASLAAPIPTDLPPKPIERKSLLRVRLGGKAASFSSFENGIRKVPDTPPPPTPLKPKFNLNTEDTRL